MNYEEKYKAALGWMQSLYKGLHGATKEDAEHYFPELKESEGEKIKREIVAYINELADLKNEKIPTSWLVWLEKRESEPNWCHHKVDLSDCSVEYRKAYYDGWNNCNMQHSQSEAEKSVVLKCLINGMKFYYEDNEEATWGTEKFSMKVKDILSWLEKQDEHKPILNFKASDWYVSKVDGKIHNMYYSADKVEPKFHEGDWVIHGYNILKIKCVGNTHYCFETVGGYVDDMLVSEIDSQFHLWTIQDAKDGDVLMTTKARNCPFIYRKTDYNNNLAYYYAGVGGDGDFYEGCIKRTLYHFGSVSNVVPATKEQRDLLFQKMKEAGYEWDADKKELKKVEPKTLNANEVIEWIDEHVPTKFEDMENYVQQFKKDFEL